MLIFDVCKDRSKRRHYRSKLDVIADTLTAANEQPIGKTRIAKTIYLIEARYETTFPNSCQMVSFHTMMQLERLPDRITR